MSTTERTRLSAHFMLSEFTSSRTARRYRIDNRVREPHERANLEALANRVLEPVRQRYGRPLIITSGYRCRALNTKIGGAGESQHLFGEAADFIIRGINMFDVALAMAADDSLPYDQLIYEERAHRTWVHVSHKRVARNRRESLSIYLKSGEKAVFPGIVDPYGTGGNDGNTPR